MIGSSKNERENYPRKFRLSVNRPSNNWALKLAFELVHFRSWHTEDQNFEPPCTALCPVPQKKSTVPLSAAFI